MSHDTSRATPPGISGATPAMRRPLPLPLAVFVALLLFAGVFLAYNASSNKTITDSRWSIHVVTSLMRHGDVNLDEYRDIVEQNDFYLVSEKDGHLYYYMPLAPYVLATPVVALLQLYSQDLWGYDLAETIAQKPHYSASAQKFIASLYTAAAVACIFLVALVATRSWGAAIAAALILAFGTSAWSVASRVLWPHGPSMLALAATLLFLELGRENKRYVPFAALPLALAYVIRPTNCVSVVLLTLYVLVRHPRKFLFFLLCALPVALVFFGYSYWIYDAPLPPYFDANRLTFPIYWRESLLGNLFSPARGLFIYSPFLIFCFYSAWLKLRAKAFSGLDATLWLIVILHCAVIVSFPDWYGGHSYGPRYLSDMLPFLVYLLLPTLQRMGFWLKRESAGDVVLAVIFTFLVGWSVFVHYRGANEEATWRWNAEPVDVNVATERLWDWQHPQFLATKQSLTEPWEGESHPLNRENTN